MSEPTGATWIAGLIRTGALIPVAVFGNCDHPVPTSPEYAAQTGKTETTCGDESHWGWGLMDRVSEHSPAGSDCNRAVPYMLRPSDDAMQSVEVRAAILEVLDEMERADPELEPLHRQPGEKPRDVLKEQLDATLARFGHPELEWTWGSGAQRRKDAS